MATRTITVHDRCTKDGCGRVLHSVREAENGLCGSCHFKEMPADTKNAMKRLLACAFKPTTEDEKNAAIDDALAKVLRDDKEGK